MKSCILLCDSHFLDQSNESRSTKATTHGHSKSSPTYASWRAMNDRCNNPNKDNYKYYGERGVTICERWKKFENFLEDMGERPYGMTLDRSDPFGNYEPSNCRWATPLVQGRNKRKNVLTKL